MRVKARDELGVEGWGGGLEYLKTGTDDDRQIGIARSWSVDDLRQVGVGDAPSVAPQHVDCADQPLPPVGLRIDNAGAPPDTSDRRGRAAVRWSNPIEGTDGQPGRTGMFDDLAELDDPIAPGRITERVPLLQQASDDHDVPQLDRLFCGAAHGGHHPTTGRDVRAIEADD